MFTDKNLIKSTRNFKSPVSLVPILSEKLIKLKQANKFTAKAFRCYNC